MSNTLGRVLCAVVLASFASPVFAADYGRTQGAFNVSGGSANYTIPVWTPPGPNGVQPSISLNYSSQSGNGLGGVGWSLAAVSSIERCVRTPHQDGGGAPVDVTINDRFCLGGNRLRLSSGTYGAAGSVYFTEIANYSRITAYSSAGNGPEYFMVEAKSGLKYEYGATPTSRVLLGTTVLRWMLNKVYDRNGNNYVVSYNNANGFAVPDVISWTPTYLGSTTYRYEAKFNYLTTRTDEDSYIGKIAGFDVSNRYRLETIQIKSAGTVVRKYRFSYDTSSATSRSRLTSAKECADDPEANCFLPLTFGYQAGQAGISATPVAALAASNSLVPRKYDFNGDGKSDLLYVSGSTWHVSFSTGTGFSAGVNTGVSSSSTFHVQRFLATHQDGLLVDVSSVWSYFGYDGSAFVSTSTGIPVPPPTVVGAETKVTDNNGDGIADLVWTVGGSVMLRLNVTAAGATVPSFASATTAATFNVGQGNVAIIDAQRCPIDRTCDVNGDGRADLMVNVVSVTGCGIGGCSVVDTKYDMYAAGSGGYSSLAQTGAIAYTGMKFNDDRCIDRIPNTSPTTIQVSGCNFGTPATITMPAPLALTLDWNGDGNGDLLVNNGGFFGAYLSRGSASSPFSGVTTSTIPFSGSCIYFAFDADGDGFDDIGCVSTTSPFAVSYYSHNGSGGTYLTQLPDLLSSVTDGFGVTTTPSYVSTARNNYTRGTATQLPLADTTDPLIVVAQVSSSDGIGGSYTKSYSYMGARDNRGRGEFVGFQRIDEVDSRNSLVSRSYFEQSFPVAGMVYQREVMQPNGVTTIGREVYANTSTPLDPPANQRHFVYTSGSAITRFEVGGTWNGNLLSTVTTANLFETTGGTLYDQTVTTSEPASGANGVTGGGSWVERSYMPTANLLNDTTNWCLGRPRKIQQINSHNLTFGTQVTRTTNTDWDVTNCRPTQVVEELGGGTLQVTTDVGYDSFGNVNQTIVTGGGMASRVTKATYSDATYTSGQFLIDTEDAESVANARNQKTRYAWNQDLGVPSGITDANGLTTSWGYDSFARRNRETRPDGTYTTWTVNDRCPSCAAGYRTYVDEVVRDSAGVTFDRRLQYLDIFDRLTFNYWLNIDGTFSGSALVFDALGRVDRHYFPVLSTASWVGWTTYSYDIANRPTTVSAPISDTNSTLQTTTISYEGLTTHILDAQGKYTHKVMNSAGQLARSQDHDGYYQGFDYDSFGKPKRVQDASGVLQSSTYNLRGMLTERADMDMGTWHFTPNALGETVSQTDAKSQSTTFVFDKLGRLTDRIEAEGTSTWTWGTSSAARNIGSLASVSGPGYSESYVYDSIGRPSTTTISADTTYQIAYGYNGNGALDSLTYPTSTSGYRLKLKYEYQNGHLVRISDFNIPADAFWVGNVVNARGQYTQEFFGNGLHTNSAYDSVTGLLKSIQTGVGGGSAVQNLGYEWDLVGNLKKRKDLNQSTLTEEFFYDNLYRLDYSQRNGVTNLDMAYDSLGNITSKSDVGSYTYHSTKKHQVASTSNGWSFGYDANGNMTSGRGATIGWTSYNYPSSIANGLDTSSFSYTPGRQYWRQVSNYTSGGAATTIYVGGILEKVTSSAGTDYRHMIRVGGSTAIVSRQSSGTNSTYYVTSDHLGSSSAITNSSGGVLVNSSFDAFGKRRGSNWSGSPSGGDWTAIAGTTRRGFTEHTMLDNLNLIHMNGRVYDPMLGRVMSADPTVPGLSTQDFNRYSYVRNNPLALNDPTGFAPGDFNTPEMIDGDDGMWSAEQELAHTRALTAFASRYPGGNAPRVWEFTGSGWFQQQHMWGFRGYHGPIKPEMSSNPSYGNPDLSWSWIKESAASQEMEDGTIYDDDGYNPGYWEYRVSPGSGRQMDPVGRFIWNNSGLKFLDCIFRIGTPCSGAEWGGGAVDYAGVAFLPIRGIGLVDDAAKAGVQFTRSSLQIGQQMHKAYKADLVNGVTRFKEYVFNSGRRADFIDLEKGIIYELKPNNPRGIREGYRQLQQYLDDARAQFPDINWTTVLDVY